MLWHRLYPEGRSSMMSQRWIAVADPAFPWEREALTYVREQLPDQEPFRAWSNFEFIAEDGSIYDATDQELPRDNPPLGSIRCDGVLCNADGITKSGKVRAAIGEQHWELTVARSSDGTWSLDGREAPGLEECRDLDFGFTPATNILQLRRVRIEEGQSATIPVAWLDLPNPSLILLRQRYERKSLTTYWYESPDAGYWGLLEVNACGYVVQYPGLWSMENQEHN